jgi:hypothetical protein
MTTINNFIHDQRDTQFENWFDQPELSILNDILQFINSHLL